MSEKYTPGVWRVSEDCIHEVPPPNCAGDIVCFSPDPAAWENSAALWPARAHLIAAAPELYEALTNCREWVQLAADHPAAESGVYCALSALDDALAKARGES